MSPPKILDAPQMRDRTQVFRDRRDAGELLGRMLAEYAGSSAIVLAIPRGGVPVGAAVAEALALPLDLAVASKVAPPWNEEYGFGFVAFDGCVELDDDVRHQLGMSDDDVARGIERARTKVRQRMRDLRGDRPLPPLAGRPVIVVDDGIATGVTVLGAVRALRRLGAREVIVAVPTAHAESLERLEREAERIVCPNVRHGSYFGVSQAYELWRDVDDAEVRRVMARLDAGGAALH